MEHSTETSTTNIVSKAVVGSVASLGATFISVLSEIEIWLRLLSLVIGIAVGIASLISIIRNFNKQSK